MKSMNEPAGGQPGPASFTLNFLGPPLDRLTPDALMEYFRDRRQVRYFAQNSGKPKHVESAERILRHEFTLNNERHVLGENFNWLENPSKDLEWLILLHKFYFSRDLALAYEHSGDERYARAWSELVGRWIRQVPDGFVNSQVTGRRLQQWLLAYHYFVPGRRCQAISPGFLVALLRSVQSQALFLRENLTAEGNHRTIELSAIFQVAILFPELRESPGLLEFATKGLLDNLRDDFLEDGVQKELSTDYHHTVLKNFLRVRELADLNGVSLPGEFDQMLLRALDFSIHAHKPDGDLPAINDGDINSYLSLLRKAHRYYPADGLLYVASAGEEGRAPGHRSRLFEASGYAMLRSDWSERPYRDARYFFFDCGDLGFGSHGHYDLLGFEAAAFGRSLLVDPGRYTYHEDYGVNWRHRFKGTAAHNTVMVDGKDQSRYRGGPPVGPQPSASVLRFVSAEGFDFVKGRALSPEYPVVHERSVFFAESEYWVISDRLKAEGEHRYDQFFHLSAAAAERTRRMPVQHGQGVASPHLLVLQPGTPDISLSVEPGFVSPEYGIKHRAPVIRYSQCVVGNAAFETVLYPFRDEEPEVSVNVLPVTCGQGPVPAHSALALEIRIATREASYRDTLFINHESLPQSLSFDDIHCQADVLFVRRNSSGEVLRLQAKGLASLSIGSRHWVVDNGLRWRLSCSADRIHWKTGEREGGVDLPSPGLLPKRLISLCQAQEAR